MIAKTYLHAKLPADLHNTRNTENPAGPHKHVEMRTVEQPFSLETLPCLIILVQHLAEVHVLNFKKHGMGVCTLQHMTYRILQQLLTATSSFPEKQAEHINCDTQPTQGCGCKKQLRSYSLQHR
jgi:hypothetical protein